MLESIFIGGGFAFAAAIQPGPLQAFLLASVLSRRNEQKRFTLSIRPDKATLMTPDGLCFEYGSTKGLTADIEIDEKGSTVRG